MIADCCKSSGKPPRQPVSDDKHSTPRFRFLIRTLARLLFLSGFAALAMATTYTAGRGTPDWFQSPIYQSCGGVGLGLVVCWAISELIMAYADHSGQLLWGLSLALAAVYIPWFYVFPATWFGESIADWETWHLLPMFAVVNMALVTTIFGVISGLVIAVCSLVYRVCVTWIHGT